MTDRTHIAVVVFGFVVLPIGYWSAVTWLVPVFEAFGRTGAANILCGSVFAFCGLTWLWWILSKDIWPLLRAFGNWLGRP